MSGAAEGLMGCKWVLMLVFGARDHINRNLQIIIEELKRCVWSAPASRGWRGFFV
jgi:hypothetical protein